MPTSKELRDIAKELGIRKYSKMNKSELTEAIEGHVQSTKAPKTEKQEEPKLVLKEPAEASTVVRGADVRRGKQCALQGGNETERKVFGLERFTIYQS